MKTLFRIILLSFCQLLVGAQDTLWLRDKTVHAGKVVEISNELIKYTREGMNDGPLFIKHTWEFEKIRFENGQLQDFTQHRPPSTAQPRTSQKIERIDNKLFYNGRAINEKKLFVLVENHPDPTKRNMLRQEFRTLKALKKKQHTWGTVGPIIAATVAVSGLISAETGIDTPFVVGVALGGVILIGSMSTSVKFKKLRSNQFFRIGELYN